MVEKKHFNILSIDGGGIRGVFPAKFLVELENKLNVPLYQKFDLICGTSTGGIIALGLALGIPAKQILDLYQKHGSKIFGNKKSFLKNIFSPRHENNELELIVRKEFKGNLQDDPRINDCKTNVCITTYDLLNGKPKVLKTKHHPNFLFDFHIPAYKAALATASAPTYFKPYVTTYKKIGSQEEEKIINWVDGGVVANNPTLIGIIEALEAFKVDIGSLRILSIGTGHKTYADPLPNRGWGIWYWLLGKQRIIDLFMQAQSQNVENLVRLWQNGVMGTNGPKFIYHRINTELNSSIEIELDDHHEDKLNYLISAAVNEFQLHGNAIISDLK